MLNAIVEFCGYFWYIVGFVMIVYTADKLSDRAEQVREKKIRIKQKRQYTMIKLVEDYVKIDRKMRNN